MTRRAQATAVAAITFGCWLVARFVVYPFAQVGDTRVSQHVARMIDAGFVPYRDFDVEYPPLATALFWLIGRLPGPPLLAYSLVMGACLAGASALTWVIATRLGLPAWRRLGATVLMAGAPVLIGTVLQTRYDLVVTLLLTATLAAALARRFGWMWVFVALAAAIKLVPVVLFPVLAIWHARQTGRGRALAGLSGALAGVAATIVPFVVIAPEGTWQLARYHLLRPLQVETLGGSVIRAVHGPFTPVFSYGSDNMSGPLPAVIATLSSLALIVAVAALARRVVRSDPSETALVAAVAATLLVAVVFGKVLSAQYLVWVMPAALLVRGRLGTLCAAAVAVALPLTQLVYPHSYADLVERSTGAATGALVARNLALVIAALAAAAAIGVAHGGRRRGVRRTT